MKNCPITIEDINVCEKVCGKNIAALKGKTVRATPLEVKTDIVPVPTKMSQLHQEVTLKGNMHFINSQPFITATSGKMCPETVDHLSDRKVDTSVSLLADVINPHNNRGFKVTAMIMDP